MKPRERKEKQSKKSRMNEKGKKEKEKRDYEEERVRWRMKRRSREGMDKIFCFPDGNSLFCPVIVITILLLRLPGQEHHPLSRKHWHKFPHGPPSPPFTLRPGHLEPPLTVTDYLVLLALPLTPGYPSYSTGTNSRPTVFHLSWSILTVAAPTVKRLIRITCLWPNRENCFAICRNQLEKEFFFYSCKKENDII